MSRFDEVFERLRSGQHSAVLGAGECALPRGLRALVIDCAHAHPVLEHARAHAERLGDERAAARPRARVSRPSLGVRRHLIGEEFGGLALTPYANTLNRLAARGGPKTALVLFNVDLADLESLEGLVALLDSGALSVPTLFCFAESSPSGASSLLFDALLRNQGPGALFEVREPERATVPDDGWQMPKLDPSLLLLLRAAALLGPSFESRPLSELLGIDELVVLQRLQEARDLGLPLEDRGRGRFYLAPALCQELSSQVMPSLASAWHERLAHVFGGGPAPPREPSTAHWEPRRPASAVLTTLPLEMPETRPVDDLLVSEPTTQAPAAASDADWRDAMARFSPGEKTAPAHADARNDPRAAQHAERAGNLELAAEKYARAAERAARAGSHVVARDYAERALELARELPENDRLRLLTASALMSLGRARWQGAGAEDGASLGGALGLLNESQRLMTSEDPVAMRAELSGLIANVCYDLGTREALERALSELTESGKSLLAAGEPLEAARLLNDEAAVWVRLGDPVRAHYLLSRSREVFRRVIASYPPAEHELAETEHMLARLLLHAQPKPGREQDALRLGIEHAKTAEQAFHGLADEHSEARVWETLGRLEMRRGANDRAAALFENAMVRQRDLGDHVGLARSTGAMADLLRSQGEAQSALTRLSDSIRHNLSTGSRGGLLFNLESLRALASDLPDELAPTVSELEQQLMKRLLRDGS